MNHKKILIIIDSYKVYLDKVYKDNKNLSKMSYKDQEDFLSNDGFGWSGIWNEPLEINGLEVFQCFYNNSVIQNKWANEYSVDKKNILKEQIKYFKPDIILIETVRDFNNEWIDSLKKEFSFIKKVVGHLCNPFYTIHELKSYDTILCWMQWMTKELNDSDIHTIYMPNAFNLNWNRESKFHSTKKELCFYGGFEPNSVHDQRTLLIQRLLAEGINIDIFSKVLKQPFFIKIYNYLAKLQEFLTLSRTDPRIFAVKVFKKIRNKLFVKLFATSKIAISNEIKNNSFPALYGINLYKECLQKYSVILNIHGEIAKNEIANMRVFEVTGSGACLLTEYKDNISDFFEIDKEVLTYTDQDDCIKKIKWINDHPEEVKQIAIAGQQRTLKDHTYHQRVAILIEAIE